MVKVKYVLFFFLVYINTGCSQGLGPGYNFDLFNKTVISGLAKAVEHEDEKEIRQLINEKKSDLNFQEPKFGNTLLHLAIAHGKLSSISILLEEGADVNIPDYAQNKAIHEATKFVNLNKNSAEIIRQLIKYGADVNQISVKIENSDTVYWYAPFMGASKKLDCAKILLENGSNLYLKNNNSYPIWYTMLADDVDESIYVAHYIIVEMKMLVPYAISHSFSDGSALDIYEILSKANFRGDEKKEAAKREILKYLDEIKYPANGVYKEPI